MIAYGCGSVELTGDPSDAREEAEIAMEAEGEEGSCGNGLVEPGEECDGGERPCAGVEGCGGGVQRCGADCRWGECLENMFAIKRGPVLVSGDVLQMYPLVVNDPLWDGSRFGLFYIGRLGWVSPSTVFFSAVEPATLAVEGPTLVVPSMPVVYYIPSVLASGDPPYLFLLNVDDGMESTVLLNWAGSDGRALLDPGLELPGDYAGSGEVRLASVGETFGAAWDSPANRRVQFIILDAEGSVLSTTFLEYEQCCTREMIVVPAGDVYSVVARRDDGEGQAIEFTMTKIGTDGGIVMGPRSIMEGVDKSYLLDAAWSGSTYGIAFTDQGAEYFIEDFMVVAVDEEGGMLGSPVRCGDVYRIAFDWSEAALTWTGSEFVAAFAEPDPPQIESPRRLIITRLDAGGNILVDRKVLYEDQDVVAPRIAWTGSELGIAWTGPRIPESTSADSHVSFAVAGCTAP
jgi:hypothetical protein